MLMPIVLQRPWPWLVLALIGVGLMNAGARRPLDGAVAPFSYGVMLTGGPTRDPIRVFAPLPPEVVRQLRNQWGGKATVLTGDVVARVQTDLPLVPDFLTPSLPPSPKNPVDPKYAIPVEALVVRVPLATMQYRLEGLLRAEDLPSHPGPFSARGAGVGERVAPADLARSLGWPETPKQPWPTATLKPEARLLRSLVLVNNMALPEERRPRDDQPNLMLLAPTRCLHLTDLLRTVKAVIGQTERIQVTSLGVRLPPVSFALIWLGQGLLLLGGGLLVMSLILSYADELGGENWLLQRWHLCAVALSERWGLYLILLVWMTLLFQGLGLLAYSMPTLNEHLALVVRQAQVSFPGATALDHLLTILVCVFALSVVFPSVGVLAGLLYAVRALWVAPVHDLPLGVLLLGSGSVILELHIYVVAMVGACCVLQGLLTPQYFDASDRAAGHLEGVRTMFRFLWLIGLMLLVSAGYEAIRSFLGG